MRLNWSTIDRSILRRSRSAPFHNRPGPEAKQSRYLSILSRGNLWDPRRPECNTHVYPFPYRSTNPVHSSYICHLGELTLVPEPGHRPNMRSVGNIATSMVTSIPHGHSTGVVQSRETSANACLL